MTQIEIMATTCIKCGEEIHPKRLEILPGVKTCVNCSDSGRKRGVSILRGEGDHSYTDVVIMDENQYRSYMTSEGRMSKGASKAEFQNFDDDSSDSISLDSVGRDIV